MARGVEGLRWALDAEDDDNGVLGFWQLERLDPSVEVPWNWWRAGLGRMQPAGRLAGNQMR